MTSVCALSLKDIRLIKDKVTNTSRGFCFVELNNMEVSCVRKCTSNNSAEASRNAPCVVCLPLLCQGSKWVNVSESD